MFVHDASREGAPLLAGIHVFASDSAGHVASETDTDAGGKAALAIPPGGSLSAISVVGGGARVISYFDLTAGDTVQALGGFSAPLPANTAMALTVSAPPVAGATSYGVTVSCGFTEHTSTLPYLSPMFVGCPGVATYDVVVRAENANGDTLAAAFTTGAPFTPGQPATQNLTWSTAPLTHAAAKITNIPAASSDVYVDVHGATATLDDTIRHADKMSPPAGMISFAADIPPNPYGQFEIVGGVQIDPHHLFLRSEVSSTSPTAFGADVSSLALSAAVIDVSNVAHPSVKWTLNPGPLGNAVSVGAEWQKGAWIAYASSAPSQGSIVLPGLPAAYAANTPTQAVTVLYVEHIDTGAASYDAFASTLAGPMNETTTWWFP